MPESTIIQLGQHRYKGAPNEDLHLNLGLGASTDLLDDQNLFRIVSALQQAQDERVASTLYRLHGTINPVSFLTNRPTSWGSLQNLIQHSGSTNLTDDFELCVGYIEKYEPIAAIGDGYYEQRLRLLATRQDLDVIPCGFAKNIFSDPQYNFILNNPLDASALVSTGLPVDWPVTDLYYYLRPRGAYKTVISSEIVDLNKVASGTTMGFKQNDPQGTQAILATALVNYTMPLNLQGLILDSVWSSYVYPEVVTLFRMENIQLTPANVARNQAYIRSWLGIDTDAALADGEQTDADGLIPIGICYFDSTELTIRQVTEVKYVIERTITQTVPPVVSGVTTFRDYMSGLGYYFTVSATNVLTAPFAFEYQPVKSVKLRDFSQFIERANPVDTIGIPANAVEVGDGTGEVIWRDLLEPGYKELSSGRGVLAPFINGCHYLYSTITFAIRPDITNFNSFRAFNAAKITANDPTYSL